MALYHFSAQIISRAKGQSACAAAAYRSGEKITNEYDGITHDYRKKQNVERAVVLLPVNAPAEYADREKLWNAVELNEKQKNAQLAREFEFALPRELPSEERERIALEFIQENLVYEGMIVDVSFHNPVKTNSKKQPIDAEGNPTKDPQKYIYENPHCHAMTPQRPMDKSGKWMPKRQKVYICRKGDEERSFLATELKKHPEWEKLYHYRDKSGESTWQTKTYVETHTDDGYSLINRYPKSEVSMNPVVEKWNSTEFLLALREKWAQKVNETFEALGMDERIDHRSYKEQGLELIPTIHEGKAITIAEKRFKEEYERKVAKGEEAVQQHTEIRDLNNAIREHNTEIRIIMDMKKLRKQMEAIIAPVRERMEAVEQTVAEKLERLRTEIISLTIKIKKAVDLKDKVDEKIVSNEAYIKELAPVRIEKIEERQLERKALKKKLEASTVLFTGKKKYELTERMEILDSEIIFLKENRKYADDAQKELNHLRDYSITTGSKIKQMTKWRDEKEKEYALTENLVSKKEITSVNEERLSLRSVIEQNYYQANGFYEFKDVSEKVDKKLGCTISDLSQNVSLKPTKEVFSSSINTYIN